jgi:pyruvate dehydrogenase E1 component beta subunit
MSVATAKPVSQDARSVYAGALLRPWTPPWRAIPASSSWDRVDDFWGIRFDDGPRRETGAARVFDVPLMEEGMTGNAIGAALVGDYPITTHIRADFSFLAMNQIINLAAKYRYMFGGLRAARC